MNPFKKHTRSNNILNILLLLIGLSALFAKILGYFIEFQDEFYNQIMNVIYLVVGIGLLINPWLTTKHQTRYWFIRLCGATIVLLTFYRPSTILTLMMIIALILPFVIRSFEKGTLRRLRRKIIARN